MLHLIKPDTISPSAFMALAMPSYCSPDMLRQSCYPRKALSEGDVVDTFITCMFESFCENMPDELYINMTCLCQRGTVPIRPGAV